MHIHKWSKWEKYIIPQLHIYNGKEYQTEEIWQKKTCLKCNKEKHEMIRN